MLAVLAWVVLCFYPVATLSLTTCALLVHSFRSHPFMHSALRLPRPVRREVVSVNMWDEEASQKEEDDTVEHAQAQNQDSPKKTETDGNFLQVGCSL